MHFITPSSSWGRVIVSHLMNYHAIPPEVERQGRLVIIQLSMLGMLPLSLLLICLHDNRKK
jgi:hypothetical protein